MVPYYAAILLGEEDSWSESWESPDAAASSSMTASPTAIPKNHSANIVITLVGNLTTWGGTTVFTPSGVTGVTKVSQSVASATSATITVTTDPSNTGTLTITESVTGSNTASVTVATATLTITPTSGLLDTAPTLTLVGANTVWSQETVGTLFSISGGTGAALGTPNITTNTAGTVTLSGGCGTGTLTITDTSTGATDTVVVAAATLYTVTPSGPINGVVDVPRTFTFQPNGLTTDEVTAATDGTGTWSGGGAITLSNITPVQATYTPTDFADSPHILSFTNDGALADPDDVTMNVSEFSANSGSRKRRLLRP